MELKCQLVDRISGKGNPYECLEIQLTPTYTKKVFLEKAELELLALNDKNKKTELPIK